MDSDLDILEKIPLTVPLLVNCLNAGKKQVDIARMCGVTEQAVSDYKQRHLQEIQIALDRSDALQSVMHRVNIARASEKLHTALDFDATKKDIIPLVAVIDRLTPALRLVEGKTTSIVSYQDVRAEYEKLKAELKEAQKVGDVIDVTPEKLEDSAQ